MPIAVLALAVPLNTTAVAWVIFAVILIGWITYYFLNNAAARKELGSEIEMAPNRKPYYDDEVLEGRRLERVQLLGVLLLVTMVIGLPVYWILEPGRQAGAVERKHEEFVGWGEELFQTTANGGFNCAGCHGGLKAAGGQAPYAVTDPKTGEVRSVNWYAPALNTVFYRFSKEEVRFILNYGRPFSPMSAWGAPGGGPMTADYARRRARLTQRRERWFQFQHAAPDARLHGAERHFHDLGQFLVGVAVEVGQFQRPALGGVHVLHAALQAFERLIFLGAITRAFAFVDQQTARQPRFVAAVVGTGQRLLGMLGAQQVDQRGQLVGQVLAVVQDQQQPSLGQQVGQR